MFLDLDNDRCLMAFLVVKYFVQEAPNMEIEILDWVIPNPSGEKAHFEKGKKVLLGILVARDCTGAH